MTKVTIEIEHELGPIIAIVDNGNKWTIDQNSVKLFDSPEVEVEYWTGYLTEIAEMPPVGVFDRIYRASTARRLADNAVLNLKEIGVKAGVTETEDVPPAAQGENGRPPPIH